MSNIKVAHATNSHFHEQLFTHTNYGGHNSGGLKITGQQLAPLISDAGNNAIKTREILFLQEKQDELLRQLHQEIHQLKTENSELKFQLYAILKALNPKEVQKSDSVIMTEDEKNTGKEVVQVQTVSNNAEIQAEDIKNGTPSSSSPTPLARLPVTPVRIHGSENTKLQKNRILSNNTPEQIATTTATTTAFATASKSKLDSPEKMDAYNVYFKKGKNQASRASFPNIPTSNYNYSLPSRSSSAFSKGTQTQALLRHNSLAESVLPPNYKDNVATLPPLVSTSTSTSTISPARTRKSSNLVTEKSTPVKPWSNSQTGQKFNPSTMTKQKTMERSTKRDNHNQ